MTTRVISRCLDFCLKRQTTTMRNKSYLITTQRTYVHGRRRSTKLQRLSRNLESRSRVSSFCKTEADDVDEKWSTSTIMSCIALPSLNRAIDCTRLFHKVYPLCSMSTVKRRTYASANRSQLFAGRAASVPILEFVAFRFLLAVLKIRPTCFHPSNSSISSECFIETRAVR